MIEMLFGSLVLQLVIARKIVAIIVYPKTAALFIFFVVLTLFMKLNYHFLLVERSIILQFRLKGHLKT
jgi:hypothetical protein